MNVVIKIICPQGSKYIYCVFWLLLTCCACDTEQHIKVTITNKDGRSILTTGKWEKIENENQLYKRHFMLQNSITFVKMKRAIHILTLYICHHEYVDLDLWTNCNYIRIKAHTLLMLFKVMMVHSCHRRASMVTKIPRFSMLRL